MFHVHAWGVPYIATVMGVKQIYPGRYVPAHLLRLIQREQVTFSHCVPTILQMLLASPVVNEVDLSRWKVIIGGSALSPTLAQQARARGVDVFTAYGMSETCPILTFGATQTAHAGLGRGTATGHPLQDRFAGATGRAARGGRGDERFAARREDAGRSGGPRAHG